MHDRHLLPDRQAFDLRARDPEEGLCSRPHRRCTHLVACQSQQQEAHRTAEEGRDRKGFSEVKWALGGVSPAPFFRFPALQHPPEMLAYVGERNIASFSCDIDSFDFKYKGTKPMDLVMKGLEKKGKGILLMHDYQKHTGEFLPELLKKLKEGGYKIVAMRAKAPVQTLPQYDEAVIKELKIPTSMSNRPMSSVVTDVSQ